MNTSHVFILTGQQGEGKTTKLIELLEALDKKCLDIAGFIAPGKWQDNLRSGFDLLDIRSKERMALCHDNELENYTRYGRFYFNPEAIRFGEFLLAEGSKQCVDLLVIDEIGLFELDGKLWANSFFKLLEDSRSNLLITVRSKFLDQVISTFNVQNSTIFNLDQDSSDIASQLFSTIKS